MNELQQTLDMLEFKCRYYETAKATGTTAVPLNMTLEQIPAQYRETRRRMREIPKL